MVALQRAPGLPGHRERRTAFRALDDAGSCVTVELFQLLRCAGQECDRPRHPQSFTVPKARMTLAIFCASAPERSVGIPSIRTIRPGRRGIGMSTAEMSTGRLTVRFTELPSAVAFGLTVARVCPLAGHIPAQDWAASPSCPAGLGMPATVAHCGRVNSPSLEAGWDPSR